MSKDIRGLQRFQSFKYGLVDDEDLGLEMLSARKLTSHAYKEERKSVKNLTAKINLTHYLSLPKSFN